MRIGMVTTSVPHGGDPIAGRFVVDMARALGRAGHAVRVLAVRRRAGWRWDDPLGPQGFSLGVISAPGASLLYDGGAPERLHGPAGGVRALAVTGALALAARQRLAGCEALVSHFLVPGGLVAAMARAGRPHLAVVHGTDAMVFARLPAALRARILRATTARWYAHAALRDRVDPTDHDAVIAPMGFEPTVVREPRDDTTLRVLAIARLVPVKDLARAVRAVARLRARGFAATLDVLGDGPERAGLQSLARCTGGVSFHGAVTPAVRDGFLARSDVLLHTARSLADGRTEGAPAALVEAMGAGLCVVATAAGGVGALVGEAGVVLPEEASPELIAASLAGLALDRERRESLGRKAMARAMTWRWDHHAARITALLGG